MLTETKKSELVIYKGSEGPELQVRMEGNTIWMTQAQIAVLFSTNRTSIGRHIRNVIKSSEVKEESNVQNMHIANSDKPVKAYSLDFIVSVGYRVNSKRATQFRIWATRRLTDYMVKGYAINPDRLEQLKKQHNTQLKELQYTVRLFQNVIKAQRSEGYEKELLNIITDYASTWSILNRYDEGTLEIEDVTTKHAPRLAHEDIQKAICRFKKRLIEKKQATVLFGQEVGGKLEAVLGSIYQTFDGKELYPSLEEKAAHLLYFAIKDHPFVDGNKRIGSLLFLLFLIENNYLNNKKGERKVNDTALVALALLVAESSPAQKNVMVKLVVNLINKK